MPLVTFLTGCEMPIDDVETDLVAAALADLGVSSRIVEWSDAAAMAEPSDLVVITSTWDYTQAVPAFLAALRSAPALVLNPIDVVEWNLHKGYLTELAAAGVAVVPTELLRTGDAVQPMAFDVVAMAADIVVKPAISAGAIGLRRFDGAGKEAVLYIETLLRTGDVLVQPFESGVLGGERSLIYLGGHFSHAVLKVPAAQDFRVQVEYGGCNTPHRPTTAELAVAEGALAQLGTAVLYARVDLIETDAGPKLMELELIEPDLFLSFAGGAADRFAAAIAERLI